MDHRNHASTVIYDSINISVHFIIEAGLKLLDVEWTVPK